MTFANARRLLEYDPIPLHPWLTVPLAEQELEIMREGEPFEICTDPLPDMPEIDFGERPINYARLMSLSLGLQP